MSGWLIVEPVNAANPALPAFERSLNSSALLLSIATLLLGLVVIFGWHTDNRTLVQILPQFVPMQYNTALGFVFSGLALLALAVTVRAHRLRSRPERRRRRPTRTR